MIGQGSEGVTQCVEDRDYCWAASSPVTTPSSSEELREWRFVVYTHSLPPSLLPFFHPSHHTQQEEAELVEFERLEQAALNSSLCSQSSLVRAALGGERAGPSLPPEVRGVEGEGVDGGSHVDLDKTLTPSQVKCDEVLGEVKGQSLAAGVEFSDDEEWNSFSHGVSPPPPQPRQQSPLTSAGDQLVSSTPITTSPTNHSPPLPAHPPHHSPSSHHPTHHSPPPPERIQPPSPPATVEAPPPPSALAARLFPALRRERERVLQERKLPRPPQTAGEKPPPTVATRPRFPSEDEVRERLCQLETEIERFRTLNSTLEHQNKEREKV